jgi:sec-independent protein translocase protein TatA
MTSPVAVPMVSGIGPPEIILILIVLVLLFGAKKLPELARGSGRALRIFKAETKGLLDDDDDPDGTKTDEQKQIDAQRSTPPAEPIRPVQDVREVHEVRQVESPVERPRPDSDR